MALPRCGIYRTTVAIGPVPAGRLVYFHNHGAPGPGIYLPRAWLHNRARFDERGTTLPDAAAAETLDPLAPEGLYGVEDAFACCEKKCRVYARGQLVQLGYNANAQPILFVPRWTKDGLEFPERGHLVDGARLARLAHLNVDQARDEDQGGEREAREPHELEHEREGDLDEEHDDEAGDDDDRGSNGQGPLLH